MYWENIAVLEAEEDIRFGNIADLPHLSKKGRSEFLKDRQKASKTSWSTKNEKVMSTKDLANMLAGRLRRG